LGNQPEVGYSNLIGFYPGGGYMGAHRCKPSIVLSNFTHDSKRNIAYRDLDGDDVTLGYVGKQNDANVVRIPSVRHFICHWRTLFKRALYPSWRARPGHPRGPGPGQSESFRRLDDVDDRDKPGHDVSAVVIRPANLRFQEIAELLASLEPHRHARLQLFSRHDGIDPDEKTVQITAQRPWS
jgi:hypothetical protein